MSAQLKRSLVAGVIALAVLLIAHWFDAGVLADAQHQAARTYDAGPLLDLTGSPTCSLRREPSRWLWWLAISEPSRWRRLRRVGVSWCSCRR